jgi:hypothetical protein
LFHRQRSRVISSCGLSRLDAAKDGDKEIVDQEADVARTAKANHDSAEKGDKRKNLRMINQMEKKKEAGARRSKRVSMDMACTV